MESNRHRTRVVLLATMLCLSVLTVHGQTMPDAMPKAVSASKPSKSPDHIEPAGIIVGDTCCLELTVENLLKVLESLGVKHKEIVAAQAVLETGHFTSELCQNSHNLFGLRHPSDGSYYTFNSWEESVKAYRDDVQYKYDGGDYYRFLSRIGYAEDRRYTDKVRRIEKRLSTAAPKLEEN